MGFFVVVFYFYLLFIKIIVFLGGRFYLFVFFCFFCSFVCLVGCCWLLFSLFVCCCCWFYIFFFLDVSEREGVVTNPVPVGLFVDYSATELSSCD